MGARKQVLASCSLLLAFNGANLFIRSRFLRSIRWTCRIWCLGSILTLIFGNILQFRESGISLTSLAYSSYALSFGVCNTYLISRRERLEQLFAYFLSNITKQQIVKLRRYIGIVNLSILTFSLTEYLVGEFEVMSKEPPDPRLVSFFGLLWNVMIITTDWIPLTCGFYVIGMRLLSLYHKNLVENCVIQIQNGNTDLMEISKTAKLIRNSSREFDDIFSILPFLWFLFGIVGAPKAIHRAAGSQGILQFLSCMFLIRNIIAPIIAAYVTSIDRSSISDLVDQAQDQVMMHHAKGASDDMFVVAELNSIKSIKFTGLSFFEIDKSFIISYIGTVLTFAALISTYTSNE